MKQVNKILALLLSVVLMFGTIATPVTATEQTETTWSKVVVNPLYEDVISVEEAEQELAALQEQSVPAVYSLARSASSNCSTLEEVGAYVREQMVNRATSINFTIPASLIDSMFGGQFLTEAIKHTESCSGQEGDALAFGYRYYSLSATGSSNGYQVSCTMSYYTDAAQEEQLTTSVNQAMSEMALSGKSELEKVKTIYEYICSHVAYDYTYQKYAAYNALVEGEAVCQGFAILFYRLCKEADLSVRIISGMAGGPHAWNIVRIGNVYYNMDTTWDDESTSGNYYWIFKNEKDFTGHERDDQYVTLDFYKQYPMAASSLDWNGNVITYSKINASNYTYTYNTIDDGSVTTTANGKPKLLIYYNDSCPNSLSTILSLAENPLTGVDIVAIEAMSATKDEVKAVRDEYGSDVMIFTYDTSGTSGSNMWNYAHAGGFNNSISFPLIAFVDANNKIQHVSSGSSDAASITNTLETLCGYSANWAKSISLSKSALSFAAGSTETATLTAMVNPSNAINNRVVWSSSNPNVCTVDSDGVVTPTGTGTAVVTANIGDENCVKNNVYATCTVTVGSADTGADNNTGDSNTGNGGPGEADPDNNNTGDDNIGNDNTDNDDNENNNTENDDTDKEDTTNTPPENGWHEVDGAKYWYENGVKQGTEGRGKEIADPATGIWYWLDAPDGKMATSKDVYQESLAGQWGDYIGEDGERYGKWVRYDEKGRMVKGWQDTDKGRYFFDYTYGTMAKGYATIDKVEYYFDPATGVLLETIGEVPEFGWKTIDGKEFWYEGYVRQGYSVNESYRGKEICDPATDKWYWLDNVDGGKKAVSKDVYQESLAGDWGDQIGADGQKYGKWVRYDENGGMIKGWSTNENGTYYFDPIYGTMAKGEAVIEGKTYYFDVNSGILQ